MFADYLLKVWPFRELLIILKLISARFLQEVPSSKNEEMKKKKHFHFICCTLAEPMMLMLMLKNSLAIMHRPGGLGEGEGVGHFLQSVFATIVLPLPAIQHVSTVQIGYKHKATKLRQSAAVSPWFRCGSGFRMVNNKYAHCLSQIWIQMHRTSVL